MRQADGSPAVTAHTRALRASNAASRRFARRLKRRAFRTVRPRRAFPLCPAYSVGGLTVFPDSPLIDENGSVVGTSSEVRAGARSELALFRKTFESLQSRLAYLETLVGAASNASDEAESSSTLGRRQRTEEIGGENGRASKRAAVQTHEDFTVEKRATVQTPDDFTIEKNVLDSRQDTPEFIGPRGLPFFDPQKQDSAMLIPSARNIFRLFPSRTSLAAVGPTKTVSDILVQHCMITTGPLHPVVSVPARTRHLEIFWSVDGPAQYERCFAAWLVCLVSPVGVSLRP